VKRRKPHDNRIKRRSGVLGQMYDKATYRDLETGSVEDSNPN